MHFAYRFEKFAAFGPLKQVAGRARSQRAEDIVRVLIYRQHEDLDLRELLFELPNAFDTVDPGQVDIHEHNLGPNLRQILERFLGVPVVAYTAEPIGAIE